MNAAIPMQSMAAFAQSANVFGAIQKWPKAAALLIPFGVIALVGYLDFITGLELSVSLLYFIPITLGTGIAGRKTGYLLAGVSTCVWFLADFLERRAYGYWFLPVWN